MHTKHYNCDRCKCEVFDDDYVLQPIRKTHYIGKKGEVICIDCYIKEVDKKRIVTCEIYDETAFMENTNA